MLVSTPYSQFVLNIAARVRLLTLKTDHVTHVQNFLMSLLSWSWSQILSVCKSLPNLTSLFPLGSFTNSVQAALPPCCTSEQAQDIPSQASALGGLFPLPRTLLKICTRVPQGRLKYWLFQISAPLAFLILPYCIFS